jgi:MFS family permease
VPESLYSIGKSIRFATTAVVNLFFGFLVAKLGTKKLILAGLLSISLSMLCHAFAENLILIYLGGFFLGLGLAWTTTTIVGYVVNLWCKENRGTIMGAILASNGIGATIATFILKPIIERNATSFKQAYILVAVILAVLALLFLILYKEKKVEKLSEHIEEGLKHLGKAMQCVEEWMEGSEGYGERGSRYGNRYEDMGMRGGYMGYRDDEDWEEMGERRGRRRDSMGRYR